MKKSAVKLRDSFFIAVRILITIGITTVIIWKYNDLKNIDIKAIIEGSSSFLIAAVSILAVYMVKGVTFVIPASLLYITVGMAMSAPKALIINFAGIILELSTSYLLGIILGGNLVKKKIRESKHGDKILNLYDKYENAGIFITRLAVFPIDLNSVFLGSVRTPYIKYLGLSLLGLSPRLILYTLLGYEIYKYIPYKYLLPGAAILLILLLVAWTVVSAIKTVKKEENREKGAYTPLCKNKRTVIFDTDMGPDCDDAGALAILLRLADKYGVRIGAVCNCTSNPYANGCIRAICEYYGYEDIKIGQHKGKEILPGHDKYNKPVVKKFCKYENSACHADDAKDIYLEILKDAPDKSVVIITAGTLTNAAEVLESDSLLFNKKVESIVSMACKFPDGEEFNVASDPLAFNTVIENFRNTMIFSGYEIGNKIKTGFDEEQKDNPVYVAYKEFVGGRAPYLNKSFDLTAVQYAFEGNTSFYSLSKPVNIKTDMNGNVKTKKNRYSNRYYIKKETDGDMIADYLNDILRKPPVKKQV